MRAIWIEDRPANIISRPKYTNLIALLDLFVEIDFVRFSVH